MQTKRRAGLLRGDPGSLDEGSWALGLSGQAEESSISHLPSYGSNRPKGLGSSQSRSLSGVFILQEYPANVEGNVSHVLTSL